MHNVERVTRIITLTSLLSQPLAIVSANEVERDCPMVLCSDNVRQNETASSSRRSLLEPPRLPSEQLQTELFLDTTVSRLAMMKVATPACLPGRCVALFLSTPKIARWMGVRDEQ
eukprot:scaffold582791_cov55-Prasinocladus_malaysianus.AAC.3